MNSFGFFVALAFVAAHYLLKSELKRLGNLGHFPTSTTTAIVGAPPNAIDLSLQALMGFLIGWKMLYLVFNAGDIFQAGELPQTHLFSGEGNVLWGILCAAALTAWRYWEVQKERLPEPREESQVVPPEALVGGITAAAAIGGILGAKTLPPARISR